MKPALISAVIRAARSAVTAASCSVFPIWRGRIATATESVPSETVSASVTDSE